MSITASKTLQPFTSSPEYRTSPIFPLDESPFIPDADSYRIYFYFFEVAYRVLGRVFNKGSDRLKQRTWYSVGLASIILITEDPSLDKELSGLASSPPIDKEYWLVEHSHIKDIKCEPISEKRYDPSGLMFPNYDALPVIFRAIIDEFMASISTIAPKLARHTPSEFDSFPSIVEQINKLIHELVYLHKLEGPVPATLSEYTEDMLKSKPTIREKIIHQNIDRIIQVNSALAYVSTQALSGAIPILERRSIIRRHSLLGIGTATLALNRIARSIENAFSQFPIENVIEQCMTIGPPLHGIENLPAYYASDWETESSVNHYFNSRSIKPRDPNPKLPYFSGRLGYRETEYTISAAQQAVTAGSSLDWSLLTITHELVHGHVRNIINAIFCADIDHLPENRQKRLHERYMSLITPPGKLDNNTELDSIRALIFAYCCSTQFSGSLTHKPKQTDKNDALGGFAHDFRSVSQNKLWRLLLRENRNIHEIFSHVLDLHYFYGSCLQAYIPLIWRSWSAVPHVRVDMRQYVLRSLLTIAATIPANTKQYSRFTICVQQLHELLQKQESMGLNLIRDVNQYLRDEQIIDLFPPFSTSLMLVDLVNKIFVSDKIRSELIADPLVDWYSIATEFEFGLKYSFPDEFSEERVLKPTPYLISRVISLLGVPEAPDDLESRTARMLLACCSK